MEMKYVFVRTFDNKLKWNWKKKKEWNSVVLKLDI